jgi:hypothetical protein
MFKNQEQRICFLLLLPCGLGQQDGCVTHRSLSLVSSLDLSSVSMQHCIEVIPLDPPWLEPKLSGFTQTTTTNMHTACHFER